VLALCTSGFAFITPSLNSLLSRRSDPAKQGAILGLGQSISSLARIIGPGVGLPLLMKNVMLPYLLAAVLMTIGLLLVLVAGAKGKDYSTDATPK
jgi:MFS family permease